MYFAKAHALGNDFILIQTEEIFTKEKIISIADRKFGIGADQILIINKKNEVAIWNCDGSVAKMCANGLRTLAKWINQKNIVIHTISGDVALELLDNGDVKLALFKAIITRDNDVFFVNVGNQHKIHIIAKNPENFEKYADNNYNVSCVWEENNAWHARTFEIGAKETNACGSAAFAIANVLNILQFDNLNVHFKYGTIKHIKEHETIVQIGSATVVAEGKIL